MTDPVSEELARRAAEPVPWRGALVIALSLHVLAFAALLVASRPTRKALSLPAVTVRLAPMMHVPAAAPAPAVGGQKVESPPNVARAAEQSKPLAVAKPSKPAKPAGVAPPSPAARGATAHHEPPRREPAPSEAEEPLSPPGGGGGKGLGLAGDAPVEGPPFPYQYYLDRVLAAIEQNWFKPASPPGTRCRVRCRISRSGELKEAGLEESSGVGAFDRAALRAVYAAAPFPPLPQGFGGSELILHLEFVQ